MQQKNKWASKKKNLYGSSLSKQPLKLEREYILARVYRTTQGNGGGGGRAAAVRQETAGTKSKTTPGTQLSSLHVQSSQTSHSDENDCSNLKSKCP